jgi:hypothetical protein
MNPNVIPMCRVETPAARASDPFTSHLAAAKVTGSGVRADQQRRAAAAVRQWPGCTSMELALKAHQDRYAVARRLPECVVAGVVEKGPARQCTISGRLALTWWPVSSAGTAA